MKEENTYVFDITSAAELARLVDQDVMLNTALGILSGVYENEFPMNAVVLDIACGPGRWACEIAREFPDAEVAGIDISESMIKYALATAQSMNIANVSFGQANILEPLDFSDNTFDLVNARFLIGVLQSHKWEVVLKEIYRILKPGGIIRLTEPMDTGVTTSKSFEELAMLIYKTMQVLGYGFSVSGNNFSTHVVLPDLVKQAGFHDEMVTLAQLQYGENNTYYAEMMGEINVMQYVLPELMQNAHIASKEDVEKLFEKIHIEVLLDDFRAAWSFVTVTGRK